MLIATDENSLRHWGDDAEARAQTGYLSFWLVCVAFLFGFVTMMSRQTWLLSSFATVAYTAIVFVLLRSIRVWRDPFNPLCLICAIVAVRHFLPALFLLNGVAPPEE